MSTRDTSTTELLPREPDEASDSAREKGCCSIGDVARASGVSMMTVSNVLNRRDGNVSAATRERVLKTIRELNYRPGTTAARRRQRSTDVIGVIFPHVGFELTAHPYFTALLSGIVMRATEMNKAVMLFGGTLWGDTFTSLRKYSDGRCDGLIVVTTDTTFNIAGELLERGVPFACLAWGHGDERVPSVTIDASLGMEIAVRHLYELGHRRIAHLAGTPTSEDAAGYKNSFLRITAELGCDTDPRLVVRAGFCREDGEEAALAMLSNHELPRPTAIVAASDRGAIGVLDAVRKLGISSPAELSVMGFDDIPSTTLTTPTLTTIRQPLTKMGATAVDFLMTRIENVSAPAQKIVMRPELVVRQSTAPPPSR